MTAASFTLPFVLREVASQALSLAHRPLGARRFRQAARGSNLMLHVGAGGTRLSGWLNTDVHWRAPLYLDALRPWPVTPGSVRFVYADDVIEHFTLDQARQLLAHAHAALASGGVLRLMTPDVEGTARMYLEGGELAEKHLERHRQVGYSPVAHRVDLLRITFNEAGHERGYLWDLDALSQELGRAGFTNVERKRIGESDHPELRNLDGRTGETIEATALVVETQKH